MYKKIIMLYAAILSTFSGAAKSVRRYHFLSPTAFVPFPGRFSGGDSKH